MLMSCRTLRHIHPPSYIRTCVFFLDGLPTLGFLQRRTYANKAPSTRFAERRKRTQAFSVDELRQREENKQSRQARVRSSDSAQYIRKVCIESFEKWPTVEKTIRNAAGLNRPEDIHLVHALWVFWPPYEDGCHGWNHDSAFSFLVTSE